MHRLDRRDVIAAPMPSGVEHVRFSGSMLLGVTVIAAPMPSGVEHKVHASEKQLAAVVIAAPMPSGVEHVSGGGPSAQK